MQRGIRVIKEELLCNKCSEFTGRYVYIAVFRGILVGVADSLQEARHMLSDMNLEKNASLVSRFV